MEALTTLSALKFTLPALRAAAPATLGMGLMVGSNGVMMGTRIVVSAEWVEMMHRLVRAGVLSLPAVSAAVRIQAGQVMMAHGELPRGVREALGDGPEVRGMRVTGKAGAGMAEPPRHHVMPQEFREWFEKRGFTGEMDIDQFCVKLEQAHHQAIHGGGNWKLGRTWPGEWNRMIMEALRRAEAEAGRMLTRNEVLEIVAERMEVYEIPMNFIRCGEDDERRTCLGGQLEGAPVRAGPRAWLRFAHRLRRGAPHRFAGGAGRGAWSGRYRRSAGVQRTAGRGGAAQAGHTLCARPARARTVAQCLPNGWPAVLDDANRFKVAKALGAWFAFTPETHKERAEQAGDALLATPPPPGWRPLGPDDELLLTLLPDEEV